MLNPVWLQRIAHFLHSSHVPLIPRLIDYLIRLLFACWLPHTADIGRRVVLGYGGLGIVIHGEAHVGDDVHIDQCVTIGGNGTRFGVPTIGNGVYIGAGAKILGPVVIGNDAVVGANAVVVTDIPSNCLAVGVPAKVIRKGIDPASFLYHRASAAKSTT
ncbi:MAG: serine acetyltransferase [Nitrospirales bacterium]|nr:serine acetyltransferase [Nitrospirales bacterium]